MLQTNKFLLFLLAFKVIRLTNNNKNSDIESVTNDSSADQQKTSSKKLGELLTSEQTMSERSVIIKNSKEPMQNVKNNEIPFYQIPEPVQIKFRGRNYFPIIPKHKEKCKSYTAKTGRKRKLDRMELYEKNVNTSLAINDANLACKKGSSNVKDNPFPLNLCTKRINDFNETKKSCDNLSSISLNETNISEPVDSIEAQESSSFSGTCNLIRTLKIDKIIQNEEIYRNQILRPYNSKNYGNAELYRQPTNDMLKRRLNHFKIIEIDYSLTFTYLINSVIKKHKDYRKTNCDYSSFVLKFQEFVDILSGKFEIIPQNVQDKNNLYVLHDEFDRFVKWVKLTHGIHNLYEIKNINHHIKVYKELYNQRLQNENDILDLYLDLFKSPNYNILLRVIPGFNLIYNIKGHISSKTCLIDFIELLQLIICKFEHFRFNHFAINEKQELSLQELHCNSDFNFTISIICIIYREILYTCLHSFEQMIAFENIYFLYFLRAYCNEIYVRLNLDRYFINLNFKEEDLLKKEIQEFINPHKGKLIENLHLELIQKGKKV
ncbi:hypothetical protein H312_00079 [Anncaliia algerae PRA339]|uniref:Uncharacterized protein n=1 Tax=Anncaliia algerae PRA339 TaxID=1288291 RepID=A0A059F616_9MICR|nr:hypothetical protein H312_00079 [Anncaliia algerae PRA339]